MADPARDTDTAPPRHGRIAFACAALVAGMVGASYAAVPLYDMFCRATGYGGTTQVATAAPEKALERTVTVRFDGNVAPGLKWTFGPEQNALTVKVGETRLAMFKAKNVSDKPLTGTASYNVTPEQTGAYFSKIQCFCFTEQTLQPGEEIDMPVAFFVDPSIAENRELDDLNELTLSYTFFPARQRSAAVAGERPKS
ncbi:cytochrome c oxidase assembly protein [Chelatococcus sambhunathii]|uniref:Cytochrome c oxidase assembly protein CtaG n=1 Tax=Chelatococcus sambhunathii TaxID=363953 RepID=A0ABU1DK62_9HYPH|nr:cytochrome c oxidase assembly protein [Chelatococcus sambhunathii]MDR4308517.1 cytochrome c oxidase assembly protein [Chelatococcus sambhunathii]